MLWTFQLDSADNDVVYHISYEYVYIYYGDFLKIGYGADPSDSMSVIDSYQDYYSAYPSDLVIQGKYIYIEFDARRNDGYGREGFLMTVSSQNTSG